MAKHADVLGVQNTLCKSACVGEWFIHSNPVDRRDQRRGIGRPVGYSELVSS